MAEKPSSLESGPKTPEYAPGSPVYGAESPGSGPKTPEYAAQSPAYAPESPANGSKTPAYAAQSPAYAPESPGSGPKTPLYNAPLNGAKTPIYGNKTPEYGGPSGYGARTPIYGNKTPEFGARTPIYGNKTPEFGARTPIYGNKTPEFGARTPEFGAPKTPEFGEGAAALPEKIAYPNSNPPFYQEVTTSFEKYITDLGKENTIELPVITLPVGTLLFRGVTIPNTQNGTDDIRYFYRDYVGDPYGKNQVCLSPTHNVFFYPFPYVSFGANDIGEKFKCMQIVVLVKPMNVICALGPYGLVRAQTWIYTGSAPFKRCFDFTPHCKSVEEAKRTLPSGQNVDLAKSFDNCINPAYQKRSGVRGWMALAKLDRLTPTEDGSLSSMAKYIVGLSKRNPSAASELIANTYKDFYSPTEIRITLTEKERQKKEKALKNAGKGEKELKKIDMMKIESQGFPEIALYPYSNHPGDKPITQFCNDSKAAESILTDHIRKDDINFMPIAMITKKGILHVIDGEQDFFSYERLQAGPNIFTTPVQTQQHAIERYLQEYLKVIRRSGITLPFYGKGTLHYDTRTGFYVLPQFITDPVYKSFLIPLTTPQEEHAALAYSIIVRNYSKAHMHTPIEINPKVSIPREFVFSRPAAMMNIVRILKLQLPGVFLEYLAKSSALFKKEGASNLALSLYLPKEIEEYDAAKLGLLPLGLANTKAKKSVKPVVGNSSSPPYVPKSPAYSSGTPEYEAESPTFAPQSPYAPKSPSYAPESPPNLIEEVQSNINVGDEIRVVKGDLSGLIGKIKIINTGGTATVIPSKESAAELELEEGTELEVNINELIKLFVPEEELPSIDEEAPFILKDSPVVRSPSISQKSNSSLESGEVSRGGYKKNVTKKLKRTKKVILKTAKVSKRGNARSTRRQKITGILNEYKNVFTNIWKLHADKKYKGTQ
jgi:hypothetical protein